VRPGMGISGGVGQRVRLYQRGGRRGKGVEGQREWSIAVRGDGKHGLRPAVRRE